MKVERQQMGPAAAEEVKKLRERIQEWRSGREKQTAMPEELWRGAVVLARRHEVGPMARELRVDFGALKKRVGAGPLRRRVHGRSNGFLELSGPALLGAGAVTGPVIEVSGSNGAKLIIRLAGGTAVDVKGLVDSFGGCRACSR